MDPADRTERIAKLRAVDIMIPLEAYPQVTTGATLRDAIRVMEKATIEFGGRRSLPRVLLVCDEGGAIVGHIRRRDALHGLEPRFLDSDPPAYRGKLFEIGFDPNLSEFSSERMIEGIRARAARPVTEVMRPIKGSVEHDDSIVTVLYKMTSYGVPLLPVERDGKVIGVVRSVEVFHGLAPLVE